MEFIEDFKKIRKLSERKWKNINISENTYGYQIQRGTKWKNGLSESKINKNLNDLNITRWLD
ncbi:MAG: hypothetical protein LBU85_00980 [Treponema sp.]|nr:hypothetical protein [Treponema sp.]